MGTARADRPDRPARSHYAFTLLTQVGQKVPSLLAAMILTRVFTPEAMGGFFFASSLSFLVALVTVFGTTQHLIRSVAANPEAGLGQLGQVLSLRLVLCTAALVTMNTLAMAMAPDLAIVVLLTSVYIIVGDLCHSFGGYLFGLRQFRLRFFVGMVGPIFLVASVPLAVLAGADLPGVLLCYAAASVIMLACSAVVVRTRFGRFPLTFDRKVLWRTAAVCWPFAMLDALQIVQFKVDVLMIFAMVSSEAAAQYETAYRLLEVSRFLVRPLAMTVFPVCVAMGLRGDWFGVRSIMSRLSAVVFGLGVVLAAIVAIAADPIMALVWGPAYADSGYLLRILYLTAPFLFVGIVAATLANALHLERRLIRLMSMAVVFNVGLNLLLIPLFQALGAAFATLASELAIMLGVVLLLYRRTGAQAPARRDQSRAMIEPSSEPGPSVGM